MFTKRGFNPDDALKEELDKTWASSSGDTTNIDSSALNLTQENSADNVQPPASDEASAQPLATYDKEAAEKQKVLNAVKQ